MGHDKSRIVQDYSRNAIFDKKHGYTSEAKYEGNQALKAAAGEPIRMMGKATMGDRMSPLNYSGNNMKLKAPMMMDADLADMPVENIAGQGTNPTMMKKNISPMNRQEYGGNKGDDSMSDKDYSSPAKMYGGKKGDDSKSRTDY
jgi:hypothetical protein